MNYCNCTTCQNYEICDLFDFAQCLLILIAFWKFAGDDELIMMYFLLLLKVLYSDLSEEL